MANAEYEAVQDSDPGEPRSELNSEVNDARTEQYVNEQRQFTTNNYDHISNQEEHVDENRNIKKDNDNVQLTELSHFLLKKDMLLSRFVRFNDKPEMFHTWKTSFASIGSELKVTPFEEANLLVKWLGPKSSEFAQTIRVSNVSNPKRGVEKIWERLDECYGSPELIDSSVRQKFERFPKLTYKDRERFYDLHDILAEILSLKSELKLQPPLSYFDTSAEINLVVSKLPPGIQSKWRDKSSAYKQRNGLVYPPFSFSVEFIRNIARTYNDPGFKFDAGADYHPRDTPTYRKKVKVTAKKTAIDGSYLKCVIYTSNHPLNECRSFREKKFAERLKLFKNHSVCFRCCNSKYHMKRDIKCTECGSRYHTSALHIAKNSQVNVESRRSHGGEPSNLSLPKGRAEPNSQVEIRTACTEVCKGQFTGKSCTKILPVYVAHKDDPAHRLKTYAILDEQSNKTLVRGDLLDYFDVKCHPEEYTLMGYPQNDAGHFLLGVDASGFGIGGVLAQMQDGRERVIAYASCGLNKAERNYCVTEKELFAVIHCVQYFRQYLLGRKFRVRKDHQALVWLLRMKESNGKVARWLEILASYDFEIEYRPGRRAELMCWEPSVTSRDGSCLI